MLQEIKQEFFKMRIDYLFPIKNKNFDPGNELMIDAFTN
jgi:hypothetical protein